MCTYESPPMLMFKDHRLMYCRSVSEDVYVGLRKVQSEDIIVAVHRWELERLKVELKLDAYT